MTGPNERDEIAALGTFLAGLVDGAVDELADAILASDWLADRDRRTAAKTLRRFADSRGVNVGDEDDDYWRGYRQAQRECLHDAINTADRIERGE